MLLCVVKKGVESVELGLRGFQSVKQSAEVLCAGQGFKIPADVLAGDTRTHDVAIKAVQCQHMTQQGGANLVEGRRRQLAASGEVMVDLAEYPRAALGG